MFYIIGGGLGLGREGHHLITNEKIQTLWKTETAFAYMYS